MELSEINSFFLNHPLREEYFGFSEAERSGCAAVAERDVTAAAADADLTVAGHQALFDAAVAEQTVFLLLNPEYLTGGRTGVTAVSSGGESRKFSASDSVLGQRAAALIVPLLEKSSASGDGRSVAGQLRITRG